MRIKFLWPGKTKNPEIRGLEEFYVSRIRPLAGCEVIATRPARGIAEKHGARIMEMEAEGLEKYLGNDYIICLSDSGKEMTSKDFARFLERRENQSGQALAFVMGGFLGLADRLQGRADLRLSLSRMTLPHELGRVVLLEQVYRALTIIRKRHYAK
jgi:23S rRNA (pseudouridine1915-N3)-methyltransferase